MRKSLGKKCLAKSGEREGVLGIKEVDEMEIGCERWDFKMMIAGVTYDFQPVAYVNRGSISPNKLQIGPGDLSQRNLLAEGMPGVRGFFLGWYWFVELVVIRFKTPESRWFFLERTAILKRRSRECECVRPRNITRFFGNKVEETSFYTFFGGWLHWQVGVNHFISHIISLFHHLSWEAPDVVISVGIGGFRPDDGSG